MARADTDTICFGKGMVQTVKKYQVHLICISLAIITFIAFEPILHNGFISFDDDIYVYKNPHITSGLTPENITRAFTHIHANNYHPLTTLSHLLDCEIYGGNAGEHHFTSLVFHIANVLLVFLVFRCMTGNLWASAFVAVLFAVHPMRVESVAWASERKDVLSTFFWILTMWAYWRYVKSGQKRQYLLAIVFFVLGLMAKPMLVTLPLVLLLLDYWPLGRFGNTKVKRLILEKIPFLAISAVWSVITLGVQTQAGMVKTAAKYPLGWRLENAIVSYVIYIRKMFWPVNLSVFYPHPKGSISGLQTAGAVLILLFITAIALWKMRQRPYIATGWLWFLGTLVPVIGIFQIGLQEYADRYTYIPYIGLFIIIVWGGFEFAAKSRYRKIIFSLSAVILLSALTIKTYIQAMYWNNNISLYTQAVRAVEDNWWGHYFLGKAYSSEGEYAGAVVHLRESMRIDPQSGNVRHELAKAFLESGDVNEAVKLYEQLLPPLPDDLNEPRGIDTSRPDYPVLRDLYVNANVNYGIALSRQGRNAEAARRFREALRFAPEAEMIREELEKAERQAVSD